jgi:hypothetical protein
MNNNVLGVIKVRQRDTPSLYNTFVNISNICDQIIVVDDELLLNKQEDLTLIENFDVEVKEEPVNEIDYPSYSPDWIFTCYTDENPSYRFNYMQPSLCANPFVNTWRANFRYYWDTLEYIRVDGLWLAQHYPILYRYIPEMDYEWDGGLVPSNQPGPTEDSMLKTFSARFLNDDMRDEEFIKFLGRKESYDFQTIRFFESLMDIEITISTAVD